MQTFNAVIQVKHLKDYWSIPIVLDVSFRQTFRQTLDHPAEYEVNSYDLIAVGHHTVIGDYPLLESLVSDELYDNDLENVELL